MSCFTRLKDKQDSKGYGHNGYNLLDESNGCVNGACTGISLYTALEYSKPGVHADQEGFYVIEGTGWAKVGDEEFRVEPDTSFIAPAGVPHTVKRDPNCEAVKIIWFHSAV